VNRLSDHRRASQLLVVMALFLRAAFVDINIDKSRSVYY